MKRKSSVLTINSSPFVMAFAIGISIYLIYIYTFYTSQWQSSNTAYILSLKEVNSSVTHSKGFLRVISTPKCGRFPLLTDLNVSDTYWQVTNTSNGTFYLFNAYFDDRDGLKNGSVIRILALINVVDPIVKTHCQMWFDEIDSPIPVPVHEYRMIWPKYWGVNTKGASPYLITCSNPFSNEKISPRFVSLVEAECGNANNLMEVRNKKSKNGVKNKFLISVKALNFNNDISLLLIEWCEFLKIFGVTKVEMFVVNVHPNVIRVLKLYQSEGFLTIKFIKFPHELPNKASESWHQWIQNDLIPYQDSFYENINLFEYMVPMDIDEFIVPTRPEDRTWSDLLERTIEKSKVKNETIYSFPVSNMYFLLKSVHENETIPGIPKELRFLSNIYRSANFTPNGGNAKTFMRTDKVLIVHNHFPFSCINDEYCYNFDVEHEDGQMAHYRVDCDNPECKESKANPVKDTTLWKYKDEILTAVNDAIKRLKEFLSDIEWSGMEIKLTM